MDINYQSFQSQLPFILDAISRSVFVSIDFELSGIPAKFKKKSGITKQTLQERYQNTKASAEKYSIIQFGLTCVEEDLSRGVYVTRPYNFYVNPIVEKKLDVERDTTFQSGAVNFLLSVNFRIETPFLEGVPYLSRQEEAEARASAIVRHDRSQIQDIFIDNEDVESIAFIEGVRQEIRLWTVRDTPKPSYLTIAPKSPSKAEFVNGRGLNAFQRRLVHQLVRAEFPELVSISKSDIIQVWQFDQQREDAVLRRKVAGFEKSLQSHVGLRWIAEALCPDVNRSLPQHLLPPHASGDLGVLISWIYPSMNNANDSLSINTYFHSVLEKLRTKRMVIVGHNVFLDLIYFYAFFFGPLPDRVEEFQSLMGMIFPLVVDTKYLADKIKDNSPSYRSSLEELDQELSHLKTPTIETPIEHFKYASDSPAHEAGYDSFLTAKILIKLSANIENSTLRDDLSNSEEDEYHSVPEISTAQIQADGYDGRKTQEESGYEGDQWSANSSNCSHFAHKNIFNLLNAFGEEDPLNGTPDSSHMAMSQNLNPENLSQKITAHKMIPPMTSDFWRLYGNKLRVNGTFEEVCSIG